MLESLMQAFRIPELKKRIYFNMIMLAIFVLGAHIPVPGIDHNKLEALFGASGFLGLVDVFSGGALRKMTVFAMGITLSQTRMVRPAPARETAVARASGALSSSGIAGRHTRKKRTRRTILRSED